VTGRRHIKSQMKLRSRGFATIAARHWKKECQSGFSFTYRPTVKYGTSMQPRRIKTYTGQTGYVYQYYFVGKRRALENDAAAPATEYVFDVTSDNRKLFAVSVLLQDEAVHSWAGLHGRELAEAEQYAAAKLRMLQAFDELPDMAGEGRRLLVDPPVISELLDAIGLE